MTTSCSAGCRPEPGRSRLVSDHLWPPADFVYTKNRDQLLRQELMAKFLELLLVAPEVKPLLRLRPEHFSVDGTLLRAWASQSCLERIDGSDDDPPPPSGGKEFGSAPAKNKKKAKGDVRGLLLSNQTHRSSSDREARLFKKAPGVGAFLSFVGHCLMENGPHCKVRLLAQRPGGGQ